MDAGTLYSAIAEVCPVVSTSVPDPNDRQSWTWVPDGSANQSQIDAGNNVVQTIGMTVLPVIKSQEFIQRFTDAEYLLLKQKNSSDLTASAIGFMHIWDALLAADALDMNTSDAQSLKSQLVTDGILTQARADQIFS